MTDFDETLQRLNPTLFDEAIRQAAVVRLGPDGAWLLLSIIRYGWRAFFDLGVGVMSGQHPEDDPVLGSLEREHQIVTDLQVQSLLYQAAEQLTTLVHSARLFSVSGSPFLDSFVRAPRLTDLIVAVSTLTPAELLSILGGPVPFDAALELVRSKQPRRDPSLDPASTPTTRIAGREIPQSVIDRELAQRLVNGVEDLAGDLSRNLQEIRALVDPPPSEVEEAGRPQPLREVDNSFRHGLRLLFRDAVPEERLFRAVGEAQLAGPHFIDVYLPRGSDTIRFASLDCSPERTRHHIDVLRTLCLRTGQFARAFLASLTGDRLPLLLTATALQLG